MVFVSPAQNYIDQIDLVPQVGERRTQELCVMSLVAVLAGERHSDRPTTACPVITAFAIRINDAIDCDSRQDLKPMAVRIMGTNDGHERDRAWVLSREAVNDVFARVMEDAGAPGDVVADLPRLPQDIDYKFDIKGLSSDLSAIGRANNVPRGLLFDIRYMLRALTRGSDELVASAAANLMLDSARLNGIAVAQNPYWTKAIDMFSQLCAIGEAERAPVPVHEERLMADVNRGRVADGDHPVLFWLFPGLRKTPKTA
ncbi:MAG: hypothetical protein HOJ90_00755 [Alphaproteobacteria bacterium]|nr:hypothetical protein [Alphaproteobacteria bacterium]